jgi:hypothetical protein
MPRVISASLRRALESRYSGDANLVFVTISNPVLSEPIRIVNDTVDFSYDGAMLGRLPDRSSRCSRMMTSRRKRR